MSVQFIHIYEKRETTYTVPSEARHWHDVKFSSGISLRLSSIFDPSGSSKIVFVLILLELDVVERSNY